MGGRSALIGVNAAAHWGLCDADPDRITVSAPHGTSRTQPRWLRIKRTGAVLDVAEAHGVAVARPADAVVTAFGDIPGRDGEEMVLAAVRRGLATCDQLDEAMSRWGALRGRAGVTRAVAAARLGCESVLEVDAARGPFRGPAFADWIRQHRLLLDAIPVRLDMYHAGSRTAIELDGATYHSDPDDVASDRRRDALLAAHGIQVLRFGTRDIRLHAQWCRETALRVAGVRSAA